MLIWLNRKTEKNVLWVMLIIVLTENNVQMSKTSLPSNACCVHVALESLVMWDGRQGEGENSAYNLLLQSISWQCQVLWKKQKIQWACSSRINVFILRVHKSLFALLSLIEMLYVPNGRLIQFNDHLYIILKTHTHSLCDTKVSNDLDIAIICHLLETLLSIIIK